ncbi:MAG: hypothetical protein EU532_14265, partial [Promethearchaeota archaeon]
INPDIRPNNLKYVILEIKTNPKEPNLVEELLKIPQLRMLDGIFGDFSLFGLLIFKSPEDYYRTLNIIDNIMAKSYFKKYQIIETIKVFKTNGISLRKKRLSIKERLIDEFNNKNVSTMDTVIIELQEKINLNQIANKDKEIPIEYEPRKFPGLIIRIEEASIIIFSEGKIIFSDIKDKGIQFIDKIIKTLEKIGIRLDRKLFDSDFEVDAIDYIILNILRDSQGLKPISTYEIRNIFQEEHQIEISQSTIHNRIKRLEEKGVILNYTVNFHPKKIGYEGKFLLRIKPKDPSKYDELATKLDINNDITDLFRIGEQYGLFAIVRVKKIGDYATFLRNLYGSEDIEDTYTNFVLDELITHTNFAIL